MKYFGLSVIALLLCFVCSGAIAVDETGDSPPQPSSSRTASDQSGNSRDKRSSGDERVGRGFKDKEITDAPPPPNRVRQKPVQN